MRWNWPEDFFHHDKMLTILMGLQRKRAMVHSFRTWRSDDKRPVPLLYRGRRQASIRNDAGSVHLCFLP